MVHWPAASAALRVLVQDCIEFRVHDLRHEQCICCIAISKALLLQILRAQDHSHCTSCYPEYVVGLGMMNQTEIHQKTLELWNPLESFGVLRFIVFSCVSIPKL